MGGRGEPSERQTFSSLEIRVLASPGTNDHEVRFLADGEDLIRRSWGEVLLGLDPDHILIRTSQLYATERPHDATIARCGCGFVECGSEDVRVNRSAGAIQWTIRHPRRAFRFPERVYDEEVERAVNDTSWETPDRTAARIVRDSVDAASLARHRLVFDWASARNRKARLTMSLRLEPGPYQILVHLPFRDETPQTVAGAALALLSQDPTSWSNVEWNPQEEDLGEPSIAGQGWRGSAS